MTLPVGSDVTFRINATVSSNASGSITNTAAVDAASRARLIRIPRTTPRRDTDTIALARTRPISPITKTDGVSTLSPGSTTTYTVVVSNNGPNAVTGATVTDAAPDSLTLRRVDLLRSRPAEYVPSLAPEISTPS